MKAYRGNRGLAPLILNLNTRSWRVINFMTCPEAAVMTGQTAGSEHCGTEQLLSNSVQSVRSPHYASTALSLL